MVCQACGNPVAAEVHFCPRCGAQVVAAAPVNPLPPIAYPPAYAMRPPRVQRNLQMLGILWCVFGAYRIIGGLIGIFALRIMSERHFNRYGWTWHANFHGPFGPPWMGAMVPFIAIVATVMAALAFLVGFSLLVIAVLSLLKFPIGTALGIYTLWVLAPATSGVEYDAIADHS
jgi:hypothetical protein